jgi:hypothetical protein
MTIVDSGHTFDVVTGRCMFCDMTRKEFQSHGKLCNDLPPENAELRGKYVFPDEPKITVQKPCK